MCSTAWLCLLARSPSASPEFSITGTSSPSNSIYATTPIFDVKDKLNRYLSRLNAFSGLVHHQNRPAIRRLQFCDSIIRVHQACESKTTLIEVASSFDIPHVQHDPIELRFHIIRWLNWRLTLMKGIAVIVVEKHFFVERLLGTGSNVD